ncbi:MAG: DUF3077 domain-containing protein [Solimonas sp.]
MKQAGSDVTPVPVTSALSFHEAAMDVPLFTVAAGVPIRDALQVASDLLDTAVDLCRSIGCRSGSDIKTHTPDDPRTLAWAAYRLTEQAKAVVDACESYEMAKAGEVTP